MNRPRPARPKRGNVLLVTPGAPEGYDPARHNYVRKLAALGFAPSGNVVIAHDPWCALLTRGSYCDCDPEIRAE